MSKLQFRNTDSGMDYQINGWTLTINCDSYFFVEGLKARLRVCRPINCRLVDIFGDVWIWNKKNKERSLWFPIIGNDLFTILKYLEKYSPDDENDIELVAIYISDLMDEGSRR